jgi:hypothetical protein
MIVLDRMPRDAAAREQLSCRPPKQRRGQAFKHRETGPNLNGQQR